MRRSHLNGWQYLYGVSAFDAGDSAAGIASLESKMERHRVLPGAPPRAGRHAAGWGLSEPVLRPGRLGRGGGEEQKALLTNLPRRCEVSIYTLAGDVVARFDHEAGTATGRRSRGSKGLGALSFRCRPPGESMRGPGLPVRPGHRDGTLSLHRQGCRNRRDCDRKVSDH
ncbi:MAG: hypothetical protein MZV64_29695 [Ignavibacteriales bacterium]|nr:hypothetical protein [Ignavibacteriales bacterium]